jgi:acetylornithine/succinyldiaminopimelate/putrescine aminotransferase
MKNAIIIEKTARSILKGKGIVEIRGKGAMLGLQLRDFELTRKVVKKCLDEGIILGWTLHSNTLIRIAPPLIIDHDLLKDVLKRIKATILLYA